MVKLSSVVGRIESSAIRDLLVVAERPDVISLAGGLPAPEAFPAAEVADAVTALVAGGPSVLQYSTTQGFAPLRAWAGARHGAPAERVVVTSGSQQALSLLATALVEPGAEVALADPGYVGAIQAFRLAGARLVGVPGDAHGMRVDVLADLLAAGHRPVLVYVVADFDNPTGATLATERRWALAGLAERYGFLVVEDGAYGALRFADPGPASAGPASVPMATLTDRVATLGTVSKVLCPGLRVGYLVAPREVADAVVLLKQATDLHTSTLAQQVVHRIVTTPGFLDAHVGRLRSLYRERAWALIAALGCELGDRLSFAPPDGGMFVWGRLSGDAAAVDTSDLLGRAVARGVAYVPGAAFAVAAQGQGNRHPHDLRLSFATVPAEALAEGARRLGVALAGAGAGPPAGNG
jgi:2-aminoadipate transaminase